MKKVLTGFFLAAGVLFIAACNSNKQLSELYFSAPVNSSSAIRDEASKVDSWWSYRFKVSWPEEEKSPDFAIDLLLAHALVEPVLQQHADKLQWWRFHRRAARDMAGHQFSFIFYTDRKTALEIIQSLDNSSLSATLRQSGLVIKTVSSNTEKENNTAIGAYSDQSWPTAIQRTWPTYIMGVSAFWLALIDEVKFEQKKGRPINIDSDINIKALLKDYHQIDDEITRLWQQEGQHALLHHLSAVMGYKPMLIKY